MESMLFITVLIFFAILLFLIGFYSYFQYSKEHSTLIERIKFADKSLSELEASGDRAVADRFKRKLMDVIYYLGNRLKPKEINDLDYVQRNLVRAGYRKQNAITIYFGVKVLCAIALPCVLYLLKFLVFPVMPSLYLMLIMIILAVIGFYLPTILLKNQITRRQATLLEGLPDALDLMVVCVEAGIGLDGAINRVGEEMKLSNKVISEEFKLMNLELRAGKSRRDALKNLAMRTGQEEVMSLTTLLIQTDKFGTSVGPALRVHSDSMRTARYQKAEELAAKLPVKLVVPLVFFIFPSLFVVIMGPALIQAFRIMSSR